MFGLEKNADIILDITGIAMVIQIVMVEKMNLKTNANLQPELVSAIFSLVTTEIVFPGFMFAMEIMIVLITRTKVRTDNARLGNVILKLNSLVTKTENGEELFASKKIGSVTVIRTVLMELMRTRPKFLIVMSPLRLVHQISSRT